MRNVKRLNSDLASQVDKLVSEMNKCIVLDGVPFMNSEVESIKGNVYDNGGLITDSIIPDIIEDIENEEDDD